MDTNYQVVLQGVGVGYLREDVAGKLAPLFKISIDEAYQMLDQHDLVVKSGVDFQAAVKYVEELESRGCKCEVQPEVTHLLNSSSAAQPSPNWLKVRDERFNSLVETPTLFQDVSQVSSPVRGDSPPHEKLSRPMLIVLGSAVLVTGVVAAVGYKILGKTDNPPTTMAVQRANATELKPSSIVEEGEGYVEKIQTVAGELSINEGELLLKGKLIYSDDGYTFSISKAFNFPNKTVLLLDKGGMGISCPSLFMFLTVKSDGQVSYTEEFGSCSGLVTAAFDSKSVVVTIPDISGGGDESWRYADEALSQIKYIDPNIRKNADKIEGADTSSVKLRGTLVRTAGSKEWELKLTKTTTFPGCSLYNPLINSLPIDPGVTVPNIQGESDFEVSLSCPNSGASISFIDLPGKAINSTIVAEPTIPQQAESATSQLSADEALACEHAKERCNDKGGVRTEMCLNALKSIRGC